MAYEPTDSRIPTSIFTVVWVVCLAGLGALNIWLLMKFRDLKFTSATKSTQSHSIVEGLLWTLAILPIVSAVIVGGLWMYYGIDEKGGKTREKAYRIPLTGIVVSLLIYSIFQLVISLYWRNLVVVDPSDKTYKQVSDVLIFSGYFSLPIVLIIIGLWWWLSYKSRKWGKAALREQIKEGEIELQEAKKKGAEEVEKAEKKVKEHKEQLVQLQNPNPLQQVMDPLGGFPVHHRLFGGK